MGGLYVHVGREAADDLRATAAPYTGWAGFNYDTGLPREQLKEVLLHCAANDIRAVMIGSGNLDLYDEVDREIPLKGRRWVLSHINTFSPQDIEKIVRMGLVLTTHTNNYLYKEACTPDASCRPSAMTRSIRCARCSMPAYKVGLGHRQRADIDVLADMADRSPARRTRTRSAWRPSRRSRRAEALRCATTNGAYLTFDEDKKGTLEPGKLADLAVLSADPRPRRRRSLPRRPTPSSRPTSSRRRAPSAAS